MAEHVHLSVAILAVMIHSSIALAGTRVSFDSSDNIEVDGKKMFAISVAVAPRPLDKTPEGRDAFTELRDGGCNFLRAAMHARQDDWPNGKPRWTEAGIEEVRSILDALAKNGMYGWIYLYDLGVTPPGADDKAATLRKVISTFKDHPATACWKGADEPAWGKVKPENIIRTYQLIKQVDPDHPVMIIHAGKGSWRGLVPYMAGCDVTGMDVFPIAYPPGKVFDLPNREISMVGDYTQWIRQAAGTKPFWMTLQIAWSGVSRADNVLRFPTFPQERFMTYEAIIFGARGLNYFGGGLESTLNERDLKLGYNWTFWQRVLRPVLEEINDKSPLAAALIASESKLKLSAEELLVVARGQSEQPPPKKPPMQSTYPPARGLDFCVRETGDDLFIIAAKREGDTILVRFTGLPANVAEEGQVLYESPRKTKIENGAFEDWFGPEEVHVYRIKRGRR